MPINYPATLDNWTNPGPATYEDDTGYFHDVVHGDVFDALEALEAGAGIAESSPQNTPIANTVRQSLTNGASKWGKVTAAMMTPGTSTMLKIAEATAGVAVASFDLTGIPQTYR